MTRDRRQWLPKAIQSFQRQTYRKRELLILADGESVSDLVPKNDPAIRLLHIAEHYTIGQKRNFGSEQARGSIIATWDDDDYSAPERLADQVARLEASGLSVTGYHSMRFTDGVQSWRFEGPDDFAIGTSLCYAKRWWADHPFPSLQVGEDSDFRTTAKSAGQLVSVDANELMVATIHPGNTEPRDLTGPNWKRIS